MDFDWFHTVNLATAIDERGATALPSIAGLAPLTFLLDDGRAYYFRVGPEGVSVEPGVDRTGTVLQLTEREWENFAEERWTRYGLLYNGNPRFLAGDFGELCRWEPGLRALFHGRPIYDPTAQQIALCDRAGAPLDLLQSFPLDANTGDMEHFLGTAGYLHVRDVFDAGEVAALRVEVERQAANAVPNDPTSGFWTKTPDGETVIANLKYGAVSSPMLQDLHSDSRVERIVALAGHGQLRANIDRNEGTKIIFKRPGATEGLTDLPLHSDCGMGYHNVACPMVLVGVHLDDGTAASGQLHMVAGSHLGSAPDPAIVDTSIWPIVALPTKAGDCTVHFGHLLHAAPPPVGHLDDGQHPRRTAYLCFAPPSLFEVLGPMEDLVSVMQRDDGISLKPEDLTRVE